MIAVDTNIIVRFLTRDDEEQFQRALKIFRERDVYIPDTVILETEWVLRYVYDFETDRILKAFRKMLGLENVYVDDPFLLEQAMVWQERGMDFADAFHLANSQACHQFLTFDQKMAEVASTVQSKCLVLSADCDG